jgi:hypothetical protein
LGVRIHDSDVVSIELDGAGNVDGVGSLADPTLWIDNRDDFFALIICNNSDST